MAEAADFARAVLKASIAPPTRCFAPASILRASRLRFSTRKEDAIL
jgi:hypothetical protein